MGFESLRNMKAHPPTGAEANDYTEQVVRGFIHKMNNLLTVFNGYSSLLVADESLDANTRNCVKEIQGASDGTSDLLTRLLGVARKASVQASEIGLHDFINNQCRSLQAPITPPGVLEIAIDPEHVVTTDPSILRQVLAAVVTNAAQALDGEGTVRIESIDNDDNVTILVLDNGDGIADDIRSRIFEPFFSNRKQFAGLGLGLPIARHAMTTLGGSMAIASAEGEGTCVHLILPKP